jgi:hypothetical protein
MVEMEERIARVKAWRDSTSSWLGLNLKPTEMERRRKERSAVLARCGTSMNSINVAICRGNMTAGLFARLAEATKGTRHRIHTGHVRERKPVAETPCRE